MNNHLIIGLGGTGGKIIRSLRKTIFQDFRSNEPKDVNIGYLYMDTSREMMEHNDPSWKVLGNSVQLDEGSKVYIQPAGLRNVIDNVKQYPGIKDWIGNTNDWIEYLNSTSGLSTAGGQRRRLGRFILASNVAAFRKGLSEQVEGIEKKSGNSGVYFHICCGLAGGTGAGTIIDVLAQIRKKYNGTNYRIFLYLFLPEEHPKENRDSGFYHSNGYAALMELNAYNVGTYLPIDISIDNANVNPRFEKIMDTFHGSYLFSNINENGNKVDVDTELPNIVADFLFQKLISLKDTEWKKEKLLRQESNENMDSAPEQASSSPTPERSIRFMGFGVKRIAIPEEEIREFITYNYANQAALQLRYNNWSDEVGFRNEETNQNFGELVANKKTHESWRTTDEHFQLSIPIIEDAVTAKWKKIGETWRFVIPELKAQSQDNGDSNWLYELKKLCNKYFEEQYRNMGVKKFYEAKEADRKDLAKEIASRIENELFAEWSNGVKSLLDIRRLIDVLIDNLQKRYAEIEEKLVKTQQFEDNAQIKATKNEKEWADLGLLGKIVGRKSNLLNDQSVTFEELYIYKTQGTALRFSKSLMAETINEISLLKEKIDKANQTLDAALKDFEKNINERCKDDEAKLATDETYKQQVIRFYEPQKVKRITKDFIKNKKEQATQTASVRSALVAKLGELPNFGSFNDRVGKEVLVNELERVCDQNAKNAEAALPKSERLFDIGIVGKLKERYDGNFDELKTYVKKLVDYSGVFLNFDQNEISKSGDGTKSQSSIIRSFTVVIPFSPEHEDFAKKLERAFLETAPTGMRPDFVYSKSKKFEIILLSLVNGFPLRFVSLVNTLRQRYELRLQRDDAAKAAMFLHTEGRGEGLPRLYVASQKEMEGELANLQRSTIPNILLAHAFGRLVEKQDANGYSKWAYVKADAFGDLAVQFFFAPKIKDCYQSIEKINIQAFNDAIQGILKNEYQHKEKKETLMTALIAVVGIIKTEVGGNDSDATYLLHKAEASKLIEQLKQQ